MRTASYLVFVLPIALFGQTRMFDTPQSPRIANYTIHCALDPDSKIITANETLTWRNTSSDTLNDLWFHLYQNAFRNGQSTFFLEYGGVPDQVKGDWGYCDIKSISLAGGMDLLPSLTYRHPDDDNTGDRTVCAVRLPRAVLPGKTIVMHIGFETKLPPVVSRSGHEKSYFSVTQWFPKIGVYEDGLWICHQYHIFGEFYADFGNYDVTITVPQEYTVGASGLLLEEKRDNGWKTSRFYCEDIHDFAWCADTDFVEFNDQYRGTGIRFLCQKDHASMADRFIRAVKMTLDFYGNRYGDYPYPVLTMIDSKHIEAGEMEYPTLFQTGNFGTSEPVGTYRADPFPTSDQFIEWLTIHECGHNWWYGMVANNEAENAWLDEGINTYATAKALEYGYDGKVLDNHRGVTQTIRERDRNGYLTDPSSANATQASWLYRNWREYFRFVYRKPALMLLTFDNYFGETVWGKVMRTFFLRWRFKHPETDDFYTVLEEVTSRDFRYFFDQYLQTTQTLDFSIGRIDNDSAEIKKEGHLRFPVTVAFRYGDGTIESVEWENLNHSITFLLDEGKRIDAIEIDPRRIIEFELDRGNNRWIRKD